MSPGSNSSSNDVMTPGTGFPTVTFSPLPHATGSAQYNWAGYAVVASVNGPIEAQRRDELPDEAFIEVHVREAKGPGCMCAFNLYLVSFMKQVLMVPFSASYPSS